MSGLLVLGVFIRMLSISQPFVDHWSWRQSDVGMIAYNFYMNGFDLFYPQFSYPGDSPGYVGSEFPLVPFIASLLYVPFGIQEWIGRMVSVVFFAASVPFLFLLVRKTSNGTSALWATAVYVGVPLSVFASRSFMSDMPSLSLSIMAMYLVAQWLERGNGRYFAAAVATTSLAILVKLPTIIIGLPMLYLAWARHGRWVLARRELWAFATLSLAPVIGWYAHSYVVSRSSFRASLFWEPRSLVQVVGLDAYAWIVERTLVHWLTPVVSLAMLVGLLVPTRGKFRWVFHWWLVAIVAFVALAGNGNARHAWYQLPMVPVAAAFAGVAAGGLLGLVSRRGPGRTGVAATAVVLFVAVGWSSYRYVHPRYEAWISDAWKAGRVVDRIAPAGARVAIATQSCDPTGIYYSGRRAWHFVERDDFCWGNPKDSRHAIENLEALRRRGATYLVIPEAEQWWLDHYREFREHLDRHYRRVAQSADYVIFQLEAGRGPDGQAVRPGQESGPAAVAPAGDGAVVAAPRGGA